MSTDRGESVEQLQMERLGRIAYEAYRDATGARWGGTDHWLPPWAELSRKTQHAWSNSARDVVVHVLDSTSALIKEKE